MKQLKISYSVSIIYVNLLTYGQFHLDEIDEIIEFCYLRLKSIYFQEQDFLKRIGIRLDNATKQRYGFLRHRSAEVFG